MGHALTRWPKGSVRDRLTPPGQFEGSAQGSYKVPLRWGGGRLRRHFIMRPQGAATTLSREAAVAP